MNKTVTSVLGPSDHPVALNICFGKVSPWVRLKKATHVEIGRKSTDISIRMVLRMDSEQRIIDELADL